MNISKQAGYILEKLEKSGFEAYLVGGCVRDFLLGNIPSDFDITTNALPEETTAVFEGERVIPTGIKHGTVTVLHDGQSFEITTYRTETTYSDGRHPDNVEFSRSLRDDLCRRDFTVNAMAMSLSGEVVDLYGGREDLKKGIIRAVGEPRRRFFEDALRILRAFRFASKLGFEIDDETLLAASELCERLSLVSRERICSELEKLLLGKNASGTVCLMLEKGIFDSMLEKPLINLHFAKRLDSLPVRFDVRLAALFIGDENADKHISSLRTSLELSGGVKKILACELPLSTDAPTVRRAIYKNGGDTLLMRALIEENAEAYNAASEILSKENCFSVADLAINGADVINNTALRGKAVGEKLVEVLFAVFDGRIPNSYDAQIDLIKS